MSRFIMRFFRGYGCSGNEVVTNVAGSLPLHEVPPYIAQSAPKSAEEDEDAFISPPSGETFVFPEERQPTTLIDLGISGVTNSQDEDGLLSHTELPPFISTVDDSNRLHPADSRAVEEEEVAEEPAVERSAMQDPFVINPEITQPLDRLGAGVAEVLPGEDRTLPIAASTRADVGQEDEIISSKMEDEVRVDQKHILSFREGFLEVNQAIVVFGGGQKRDDVLLIAQKDDKVLFASLVPHVQSVSLVPFGGAHHSSGLSDRSTQTPDEHIHSVLRDFGAIEGISSDDDSLYSATSSIGSKAFYKKLVLLGVVLLSVTYLVYQWGEQLTQLLGNHHPAEEE